MRRNVLLRAGIELRQLRREGRQRGGHYLRTTSLRAAALGHIQDAMKQAPIISIPGSIQRLHAVDCVVQLLLQRR